MENKNHQFLDVPNSSFFSNNNFTSLYDFHFRENTRWFYKKDKDKVNKKIYSENGW